MKEGSGGRTGRRTRKGRRGEGNIRASTLFEESGSGERVPRLRSNRLYSQGLGDQVGFSKWKLINEK